VRNEAGADDDEDEEDEVKSMVTTRSDSKEATPSTMPSRAASASASGLGSASAANSVVDSSSAPRKFASMSDDEPTSMGRSKFDAKQLAKYKASRVTAAAKASLKRKIEGSSYKGSGFPTSNRVPDDEIPLATASRTAERIASQLPSPPRRYVTDPLSNVENHHLYRDVTGFAYNVTLVRVILAKNTNDR
jgi:hypothetical protein